jgi:tetratricopeptide (TPR) repeat protein
MISRQIKNRSGRDAALRIAFQRISSAGIVALAMLTAGCETLERMKEAVTPDPAPAKKAPAGSDHAAPKKAPAQPDSQSAAQSRPATAAQSRPTSGQAALNEGIQLYDKGEFEAAIKQLNAPEISSADKSTQTKALKYMAFSYCVTSRQTLCRRQFEKALKIDPAFDLEPGEKGHPLWSATFDRAKKRK